MTDNTDERLKKDLGVNRQSRGAEDRKVTQNREVTEADRLEMFRKARYQDALPDLPEIPGYHVCWLTTTNPRDSIQNRVSYGYEPIRAEDAPGLEYATMKTGEYAGCIGVNEMLAFKLPESLYQAYMKERHNDEPRREEELIAQQAEALQEEARRAGADLIDEDGTYEELRRDQRPVPQFS